MDHPVLGGIHKLQFVFGVAVIIFLRVGNDLLVLIVDCVGLIENLGQEGFDFFDLVVFDGDLLENIVNILVKFVDHSALPFFIHELLIELLLPHDFQLLKLLHPPFSLPL